MTNPNIFTSEVSNQIIDRINKLSNESPTLWGKMNVAQMFAHCNVSYEYIFTDKHPKPNFFTKLMLKLFVKNTVVGDKKYKKNNPTAPPFKISDQRVFEKEKNLLIENIIKVKDLGENHFDGKESHSFGVLNKNEWNNMFYKHLDHHLAQFGV
ncbi:MAG: DUF1569 domain-containing protein [Flavobacteriia bacterium]|nr:DUF1569 domain-containing protein [Flavobacteriia bacterium]